MRVVREETCGQVLPVVAFDDLDEALALANDTEYGLTSSVFTRNLDVAMRASNELQFGETYVNREHPRLSRRFTPDGNTLVLEARTASTAFWNTPSAVLSTSSASRDTKMQFTGDGRCKHPHHPSAPLPPL